MLKLLTYAPFAVGASYLLPALALAQPQQGNPNKVQVESIVTNITGLARLIITLLFVLAILVFVWGMVRLITAAGDAEKIKEARAFMWWGVIAMAVLASVFGLITFLQTYFGIGGGGGFTVPTIPGGTGGF